MNKLLIIVLFTGSIVFNGNAQNWQLKNANRLFASNLYLEAMPIYENLIRRDSSNYEVLSSLAECYRMTNNNNQILCYKILLDKEQINDKEKLNYGQALMLMERYDEAKTILTLVKNDNRASLLLNDISKPSKFTKNSDAYSVSEVSFNSTENDMSAYPFLEGKVIFVSNKSDAAWIKRKHGWTGNSYCHLFVTEKNQSGTYEIPTPFLPDYSPKFNDGPFCSNKIGSSIFFTRNTINKKDQSKDGAQKLKIIHAEILNDNLKDIEILNINSNEYNCAHPSLSADEKTLYFSSDMPGGKGGMDIWYSKLETAGYWSTPINMGDKVNTSGNELFPSISKEGILHFASNGLGGLGGLDIYETKIVSDIAGKVYNMGKPVNSSYDDFSYYLDDSGTKGYLTSNRKSGGMDDNIYSVNVLKPVIRGVELKINAVDKVSQQPIPYVKITLNTDTFRTDEKGQFQKILADKTMTELIVSKVKYSESKDTITINSSFTEDEINKTISLEKNSDFILLAGIYDAITGKGIEEVTIKIKDLKSKDSYELLRTNKNGEYKTPIKGKNIGDTLMYSVTIEKDGFLSKTLDFVYTIMKPGEIQLNELLNISISKADVGLDLGRLVNLKDIYFDKGKAVIRPDAAIELDKIVAVMKQFPNMTIELGAHTDSQGPASANMKLSASRATATANYIVKKGIAKNRVASKGYGETKILNKCLNEGKTKVECSEAEHSVNRRIEFIVTKMN